MSESSIRRLNSALEDRYRIERELGEGGMATVYLAEDLKHHRKVALKVLKPELAAVVGAERFLAEIEVTAGLQHPHILPLFDSGEADGFLYYVMPYVEGESLRERLDKEKQLPVEETVRIATDVAEALDHAHRHDVIHRDVKPANILLQDGRPVVADFGIALAVSAAGGGRLTETGLSLGTPYYMSPEQATGDREVDPRSDIYALGCVVYEMLTGEPPFSGKTAQAVLGRILMGNVDPPTVHRKSIPPNVEGAILRALERLPADRFATATEFVDALKDPGFRHATGEAPGRADVDELTGTSWRRAAVVGLLAAILAAAAGWALGRGAAEAPAVERQRVVLGSGPEQVPEAVAFQVGLHPAGEGILFPDTDTVGGTPRTVALWKSRSDLEPTRISSLDGAITPTFSPDGGWILFVQNGDLRKQPLQGGNSVTLVQGVAGGTAHALAWLDNDRIIFEDSGFTLLSIDADGQEAPDTVSVEERTGQPIHMTGLPGGREVLVSGCVNSCPAGTKLSLLDLEADTVFKLADGVVRAWPAPGGRVIYLTREGAVFAAALDRDQGTLGPPTPLFDGVRVSTDSNGEMHVAPDGTALFVRGTARVGSFRVVNVDRTGRATGLDATWGPQRIRTMALSPSGDRLAVTISGSATQGEQLWVKQVPDGPLLPLTPGQSGASRPVWFADGSRIAYRSVEGGAHIRSVRADGTSPRPDTLFLWSATAHEVEFTPSEDTLLVRVSNTADNADVLLVDRGSENDAVPLLSSPFNENAVDLSPDGRWLAYQSNVSGRDEIYARPFPDVSARQIPISRDGGSEPLWNPNGQEIFYRDGSGWMVSARVSTEGELRVESRERLFDASDYATVVGWRGYDVTGDGESFLMLAPRPGSAGAVGDLVLVENLFEEMKERMER